MGLDTSIYQNLLARPRSAQEYMNDNLQTATLQQNMLAQRMQIQEKQRGIEEQNTIRNALMGLGGGATDEQRINALKGTGLPSAYAQADALEKSALERTKAKATADKDNIESAVKAMGAHRDLLSFVNTPQDAAAWVQSAYANPALAPVVGKLGTPEQMIARIPQTPQEFAQWKRANALGAEKFIEQSKPNIQTRNTGGSTDTLAVDPFTGKATVTSSVANTQSPDNAASNAAHLQAANISAATSRANNRDTIAAENARAGVTPGGGLDDNAERTAKAIASGQLPAPTGMALLNPKNQRILGRVMEINPEYDSTTVEAKKKAAKDFTTGQLGNAMRSFAVAGQHLDQLGQLVDAMGNGNMQLVNKIGNAYSQQTGNPAVTNFDAAKEVVSKEVVKAIVAGGGGVSEREELSKLMEHAKSPAQLYGVIKQYRNLMGAQHEALLQQRRAAGLKDETMPKYNAGEALPQGWSYVGTVK